MQADKVYTRQPNAASIMGNGGRDHQEIIGGDLSICNGKRVQTHRLILRSFEPNDFDQLFSILSDPRVLRHLGESGKPLSVSETQQLLENFMGSWERHGFGRWAIELRGTPALIGFCGFRSFEGVPELLYILAKDYWGHGYATEAATASLRFGFEVLGLDRIMALVRPINSKSKNVLKKIGMRAEKEIILCGSKVIQYHTEKKEFVADNSIFEVAAS